MPGTALPLQVARRYREKVWPFPSATPHPCAVHAVHTQPLIFQAHSLGRIPCSPPTVKEIYFSHEFLLSSFFPETLMDLILINDEAGSLRAERSGWGNVSLERRGRHKKERRPWVTETPEGEPGPLSCWKKTSQQCSFCQFQQSSKSSNYLLGSCDDAACSFGLSLLGGDLCKVSPPDSCVLCI